MTELYSTPRILTVFDVAFHRWYIPSVEWEVEYTHEFEDWWESLDEDEQESVTACVLLLEARAQCWGSHSVPA